MDAKVNCRKSIYVDLDQLIWFCFVELTKQRHTTVAHNNKCPSFLPSYQDVLGKLVTSAQLKLFVIKKTIAVTFLKNQFSNFWTFRFLPLEIFHFFFNNILMGFSLIDCEFSFQMLDRFGHEMLLLAFS